MSVITIERKIPEKNDEIAAMNRNLFKENKLFTVNVVSSPGSGKTSLLERTIEEPKGTTEGDDKPLKYPKMFINSSVLIINKIDLLPYVNCSMENLKKNALQINPNLNIFETSCTSKEGIPEWCDWILENIKKQN
jgi:Ni2+-binding GTPase involved in maturation of urease and hydrogenase